MTGTVRVTHHGEVATVEIDNPPVNALAQPVRAALLAAVEALEADPDVRAIVLHGAGRQFVAGADVREFDADPRQPLLVDVLRRVEGCGKIVIAALHGNTLGGGAELALASHYRTARADLAFGFPEIKLGLLPGAGGTVRLPRVVGVAAALELMATGESVGLTKACELGLIDREFCGEPAGAGIEYARRLFAQGAGPRRVGERAAPPAGQLADCKAFHARLPKSARVVPAGARLIAAVEASITEPFEEAVERGRAAFEACRVSPESRALRHLFFAERARPTGETTPRPVDRVGVVGAGTMGVGISVALVGAGLDVVVVDSSPEVLASALARVRSTVETAVARGRFPADAAESLARRFRGEPTLEAFAQVDLVIEAVHENMVVKERVFADLGRHVRVGTVLATNTSSLDVDALGVASGRPADVVGMHFFSPPHVMQLVEVVRARDSSDAAVATAWAVIRRLGKVGVEVGNAFGFVGNRMLYAYGREKEFMLLEGASPEQIDAALEAFGMAMGPNAVGDLAGLDVGFRVRQQWRDKPDDPRFYRASDMLAEQGRHGQKTGRGFYRYEAGRRLADPETCALIRAEADRLGVERRTLGDEEIVERCTLALVNEGARVLEEGVARRAADVDVVWCHGYGFPRTRGGPMFHADTLGLSRVVQRIHALAAAHGPRYWTPAPLLESLAAAGRSFADFDAERASR